MCRTADRGACLQGPKSNARYSQTPATVGLNRGAFPKLLQLIKVPLIPQLFLELIDLEDLVELEDELKDEVY